MEIWKHTRKEQYWKGNGEQSGLIPFAQPSGSIGVRKRSSVHIRPSRFFCKVMSVANTGKTKIQ